MSYPKNIATRIVIIDGITNGLAGRMNGPAFHAEIERLQRERNLGLVSEDNIVARYQYAKPSQLEQDPPGSYAYVLGSDALMAEVIGWYQLTTPAV